MDLRDTIIQGGLIHKATQDYDEKVASRSHAQAAREHGVRKMESERKQMDADDSMIGVRTEVERLRKQVEQAELDWQRANQSTEQAIRTNDLRHRQTQQPAQQAIERNTTAAQVIQSEAAPGLARGQTQIAGATQTDQMNTLRERQTVNMWNLLRLGDTAGAMKMLSDSNILYPGRKFSEIVRGRVPAKGADGTETTEEFIKLVPADGGKPEYVPVKALDQLAQKHGSRYEKVGNNIVRIDSTGTATPIYEQDQFVVVPEGGSVASRRTGLPPAAAGVNAPPGGPGARPPGSDKATGRIDTRVKQSTNVINRYFGVSEFSGLDQKNQPKYTKMVARAGELVREGKNPEAAAQAAIDEVNREAAVAPPGGRSGGYSGPTPWRQ